MFKKTVLAFTVLVSTSAALAGYTGSPIAKLESCKSMGSAGIATLANGEVRIRTTSPRGPARLWSLEKDFKKTAQGDYENAYFSVGMVEGQINTITIKNLPTTFNCEK